jgi:predicted HAD superfamily Cof-like phosphohydrolase
MAFWDVVAEHHVRQAVAEYDRLGQDEFLAHYGFGRATAYLLIVDGKAYDSKAVLGVAYQLATGKPMGPHDFSGGVHGAAGVLRRLGFEVRNVRDRQRPDSAELRPLRPSSGGQSESQIRPIGAAAALAQFHRAFNLPMRHLPSADIDHALARLRVALLEEEVGEFVAASERGDLIGVADALADIVYVVYGTALTYGIDLDAVLHEVHRSNMSKLGSDGKPLIREDGKVLKSERYFPPGIESVLRLQKP